MLVIMRRDGSYGNAYTYSCTCDCGSVRRNVPGESLRRGKTKCCGCSYSDNYCPKGLSENQYLDRIKFILLKRRMIVNECWEYTGQKTNAGYGFKCFGRGKKKRKTTVHRIAFILWKGSIPKGKQINHSCDNPICFNPDHLWAGTQKQNMEDMSKKGRGRGAKV